MAREDYLCLKTATLAAKSHTFWSSLAILMICSLEGRENSLYCNGWGGFRDFHISDMDKSRRISLLNTFSKTREAKSVVPIASLMAFNSCASFFRFAISSTDYKHM